MAGGCGAGIPVELPFRTLRWRVILRNQKALSFKETLVPVVVCHMVNNVLPARAGEVYRAHFLGRRARMSRSGAMGSIVVERTFDGLMLVAMTLLVLLLLPHKETAFVLPGLLLLCALYERTGLKRAALGVAPFAAVLGVFLAIRHYVLLGANPDYRSATPLNVVASFRAFAYVTLQMFAPINLDLLPPGWQVCWSRSTTRPSNASVNPGP